MSGACTHCQRADARLVSAHLDGAPFCGADCRDAYIGATHRYSPHDAEHVLVPVGSQLGVLWRRALAPRAGPTLGRRTDDGRHYVLPYDVVEPIAAALQRIGPQTKRNVPSGGEDEGGEERESGSAQRALTETAYYWSSENMSRHNVYVILRDLYIDDWLRFAAGMRFTPFYTETLADWVFWDPIIKGFLLTAAKNPDLDQRSQMMHMLTMRIVRSPFGRGYSPAVEAVLGACFHWLYINYTSLLPQYKPDGKPRDAVQETFALFCSFSAEGVSPTLLRFVQSHRYAGRGISLIEGLVFETDALWCDKVILATTYVDKAANEYRAAQRRRFTPWATLTAAAAAAAATGGATAPSSSAETPVPAAAGAVGEDSDDSDDESTSSSSGDEPSVPADREKAEFLKMVCEWRDALGRAVPLHRDSISLVLDQIDKIILCGPRTALQLARLALLTGIGDTFLMQAAIYIVENDDDGDGGGSRVYKRAGGLGASTDYSSAILSAVSPNGRCLNVAEFDLSYFIGHHGFTEARTIELLAKWQHPLTGARIDFTRPIHSKIIVQSLTSAARHMDSVSHPSVWRAAFLAIINAPVTPDTPVLCDALMRYAPPRLNDYQTLINAKCRLLLAWCQVLREMGPAAPQHARVVAPDTLTLYPPTLGVTPNRTKEIVRLWSTELLVRDPVSGTELPARDWIAQNLEQYFLAVPPVPLASNVGSSYLFTHGELICAGLGLPRIDLHRLRARLAAYGGSGPSYLWNTEVAAREQVKVRAIEAEEAAKAAAAASPAAQSKVMDLDARIWHQRY